jgi:RsiW-degrading membrane proteinase PrsW (M82 family)
MLSIGAIQVGAMVMPAMVRYPRATFVAFVLFALYAVPFVAFIANLDYLEREPPVLLAVAFAWGGLVVTAVAVPGNTALDDLVAKLVSPRFATDWGPAIAGPTVEEVLKFLGVVVIALLATSQVNSVVDGFVYGAMVGLGYQVVENIAYATAAVAAAGTGDRIEPVIGTFIARGFLAGPWSHTVFTALAGAGVGYAVVRVDRSLAARVGFAGLCLGGAWLAHFAWNSPLLSAGFGLGTGGTIVELLFKGAPVLIMVLLLAYPARLSEGDYYAQTLAAVDDPRIVTPAERATIGSPAGRAATRRAAQARAGAGADRGVRRLQQAQAHLAVQLSRGPAEDGSLTSASVNAARDVLLARHALIALGLRAPGARRARRYRWRWAGAVTWLLGSFFAALLAYGLNLALRALM